MKAIQADGRLNRLAIVYGLLWAVVAVGIYSVVLPFMLGGQTTLLSQISKEGKGGVVVSLICACFLAALPTAVGITWFMRRQLVGRTLRAALWRGPLALLVGAALFGPLLIILMTLMGVLAGEMPLEQVLAYWWMPMVGIYTFPLVAFILPPLPLLLIPLACWNTWDLWKRVNPATPA